MSGALGWAMAPVLGGIVEPAGAAEAVGAADEAAGDAEALLAGEPAPFLVQTMRPKREALWKLP